MILLLMLLGLSFTACKDPPKTYERVRLADGRILYCQVDTFPRHPILRCTDGVTIINAGSFEILPTPTPQTTNCNSAIDAGSR